MSSQDEVDAFLHYDEDKVERLRQQKPWMKDAKHFKTVRVAACAAMKMMAHAVSGVEKGMGAGGKPVEVMGLMLGYPSPNCPNTLIVSDAFPLPIEGAETRVLADDQEVLNYMIDLGESLEETRRERFMGWYHSHPFDVEVHTHCFMSSTDITTQLGWQRAEDRNGNPWLGIVLDPLRSLAKGRPEIGAFRAYPPEYTAPSNETPDGTIETDDKARVERWGSCWNRYHALEVKYFMSSLSANVLTLISKNVLWMNAISTTPTLEKENRDRFAERVNGVVGKLNESSSIFNPRYRGSSNSSPGAESSISSLKGTSMPGGNITAMDKAKQRSCDISVEQLQCQLAQISKHILFASR